MCTLAVTQTFSVVTLYPLSYSPSAMQLRILVSFFDIPCLIAKPSNESHMSTLYPVTEHVAQLRY